MPRRLAIALVFVIVAVGALAGSPASARTIGPCAAQIAGQDAANQLTGPLEDPIVVHRNSLVPVSMSAERPLTRYRVELEFAGVRWKVHEGAAEGTRWASEVPVTDYGVYGMGLWKVVASTEGSGFTCEAAALVSVEDDHPLDALATISGLAGLGLALTGFLGTLVVAGRIGRAKAAPFAGLFLGALFGVGVCVLLQQFSVVYPTIGVAGALVAAGAAFGLAFSLFGLPARTSDARNPTR
jgi:hypothetical protein